jgi:hypothetical protein
MRRRAPPQEHRRRQHVCRADWPSP